MSAAAQRCFHCGAELPGDGGVSAAIQGERRRMCCAGCAAAAELIASQGLERFYQYRDAAPHSPAAAPSDWSVYERPAAQRRFCHLRPDGSCEFTVQLEGLRCAACVWLIENSLPRSPGVLEVSVNLAERRARLRFDPARTRMSSVLGALARLGYTPRPISWSGAAPPWQDERRAALRRLAVAGLGMMQIMSFAAALYAGALEGMTPAIEQLLRYVSLIVATPVVLYAAQPFFAAAARNLRARTLGMDLPVALSIGAAYVWSLYATLRGRGSVYFDSAVMFTFFLLLGRYIEMTLRHRAGQRQEALGRLLPEGVLRLRGGETLRVTPEELEPGDHMRVLPGERVAADGTIVAGTSELDDSLLTGESLPRPVRGGDEVSAGTLNLTGVLEVAISRIGADSTLAGISRLLERAQAERPAVAELADRVAGRFVGAVLIIAAVAGAWGWHTDPGRAFETVLAVLVVTCPCALSLATPAALAAASARLARVGLLVTRTRALAPLARADRIVFDKTGTLTRGRPRLEATTLLSARVDSERCLAIAGALESYSNHPLAHAFRQERLPRPALGAVAVSAGRGVAGELDGVTYRIGSAEYVLEGCRYAHALPRPVPGRINVYLGDHCGPLAQFALADTLRADAALALGRLRGLGLTPQIASGDRSESVTECARQLGVDESQGVMNAAGKLYLVQQLQRAGHRVVVVGDGINDAPILAGADVSVAIGGGSDLARVSADLILLNENLGAIAEAVRTARLTVRVIAENLTWAVIYNLTAIPLAASGWLPPWTAALGMSLSSLLVVLNALRILPGAVHRRAPGGAARLAHGAASA